MKHNYIILLAAFVLASCEVIKEMDRLIPVPVEVNTHRTHILLEFTGFRCVNCPTAAQTAQNLKNLYGEQLLIVALHPASNPFTQGKYDYTCPAADSIYRFMGGTETTSFPAGNIDITPTHGDYFMDQAEWAAQVYSMMQDSVCPSLSSEAVIDTSTRMISVTSYVYSEQTIDARLAVWVVEDSIHGVQAMPDGTVNMDYIHRHMLRTTANGRPWGTAITLEPTVALRHTTLTLPEACDITHCKVITLLLNKEYKILQAYETDLDYDANP